MSDNDPFAEPEDTDKTVVRPRPAGRPAALGTPAPSAPAPPPRQPAPEPAVEPTGDAALLSAGRTGPNPLVAEASTLFSLISRTRNRAQHPDPEALRRSVVAEVRQFESRALAAGIDPQQIKIARYAICATIDDVVLNTPWGGASVWAQQSMVATFHRETVGGDRFYDLLARLEQDPGRNIDLLEFLYLCLSLGFEGRLRVDPNGAEKHMEIRSGLARIIRAQRGDVERDISPRWKGVNRPHKPLSAWKPVWIAIGATAAVLLVTFMTLNILLARSTDRLAGQFAALASEAPAALERRAPAVEIPPVTEPDAVARVSGFLTEEIEAGLVEVDQDGNVIRIRIKGSGMFGSGSDSLQSAFDEPLTRVANALDDKDGGQGPVIVVGHTDSIPINTARFPSNRHLSLARADSVKQKLASLMDDPSRLSAEGRADAEPIGDNATPEGRALNRRIEILFVREEEG